MLNPSLCVFAAFNPWQIGNLLRLMVCCRAKNRGESGSVRLVVFLRLLKGKFVFEKSRFKFGDFLSKKKFQSAWKLDVVTGAIRFADKATK